MEFKHFSHNHGLVSHQMPQGSEFQCSGCKYPGSGNVFVCWLCTYFLHDQCYRAARSLKHLSHPLHPLTLVPFPTYPSGSFLCNTCKHPGDGSSYSCSECEFDVHVHCALMPNAQHSINPQPQNPIYPPPIQTNAHPSYPPRNPTIPNDIHSYPPPTNPMIPNVAHTYPPPPPHNPTIPNDGHTYPPPPRPQNATYTPIPNNPYPNFTPPDPTIANQPQDYTQTNTYPPNHNNPLANPNMPQPNHNFVNYPNNNPPPPQSAQPNNPTAPTYNMVVNITPTTTTPTNNNPPVSQPNPTQYPKKNNSEPKPPAMIKHFSHTHVLKPMDIDPKNAKVCSACECELSGSAYCCTEPYCTFNLHKTCFDLPRELRHKSHLEHPLTLLAKPPYDEGFTCDACLKEGKAFVYTCSTCSYDVHIDCVQRPDTMTRPDHKHALTLYYSSPLSEAGQDVTFVCDACRDPVHELAWVYYCRECDFGTHLKCVTSGVKEQYGGGAQSDEEFSLIGILLQAQGRKAALELIW